MDYPGVASRIAARELGGIFAPRQSQVAVGLAAVPAVFADPNRISLVVTNNSANNITLSNSPGPTAGQGILLLGNGAVMSLNFKNDGDSVTAPWYAISDLAGGSINVWESVQVSQTDKSGA